jgi:hypothetical protein
LATHFHSSARSVHDLIPNRTSLEDAGNSLVTDSAFF